MHLIEVEAEHSCKMDAVAAVAVNVVSGYAALKTILLMKRLEDNFVAIIIS